MSNLIPQKRPDKNGRMVTRHVKLEGSTGSTISSVPAPSLSSPTTDKPAVKPSARQKEFGYKGYARIGKEPHDDLKKALSFSSTYGLFEFKATDADVYDAFSVTDVGNALLLMQSGYKTKDEIIGFLTDNNLEHLLLDRSAVINEALARRIDPGEFGIFHSGEPYDDHDPKIYVDAAEASSSRTLMAIDGYIPRQILEGRISMDDIKAVGISRIRNSNAAIEVINTLRSAHQGNIDCTAQDVRKIIETHTADNTHSESLEWALSAVWEHGGSFMAGLYSLSRSHRLVQSLKLDKFGPESLKDKRKKVLEYNDALIREGATLGVRDFSALYHSGVDPHKAGRLWEAGLKNVNQIIATETEDVNPSIATGWL